MVHQRGFVGDEVVVVIVVVRGRRLMDGMVVHGLRFRVFESRRYVRGNGLVRMKFVD